MIYRAKLVPTLCVGTSHWSLAAALVLGMQLAPMVQASPPIGPRTEAVALSNYQKIWHVSQNTGSDDEGDGSQSHPWQTLGHAMDQATGASPKHRYAILVAEGRYGKATLPLKEYVDLFGGFEPTAWKRDVWMHVSMLQGAGKHRILVGADHARIDGFLIYGGAVRGKGAGLLCDGTSPTVTNNRFLKNKTSKPVDWDPQHLHEIAHDGGGVFCGNGASPVIANNVFAGNETEIGRGAAIALDGRCAGRIANNVFFNNTTGLDDPMRSSDGGAISVFDWSHPVIENNVILSNRAFDRNDGGGIFVALWSSPIIRRNVFVDNQCKDDAGALFVGGQEHRYDKPFDPQPSADRFFVRITENIFVGNRNRSRTSGAIRFTMEGRGLIANNVMAHNSGFSVEKSDVSVVNNTIMENVYIEKTTHGIKPKIFANNIIWGQFITKEEVPVTHCNVRDGYAKGTSIISEEPLFLKDWEHTLALSSNYNRWKGVTDIYISGGDFKDNELVNRVVKAGELWSVIKSNHANRLTVWGNLSGEVSLFILPTYRLRSDSPDIDQGLLGIAPKQDILGNSRPLGKGVDLGANEFAPEK